MRVKKTNEDLICELNILKNRLEAGESIIQCLNSMGIPLQGSKEFLTRWQKLSHLMIEGRILPAKAIEEFVSQLEDANQLLHLAQQKTLSPRIQAYMSLGIIALLLVASIFLFPEALKPSAATLTISVGLSLCSAALMHRLLTNFLKELCFLEWIAFLRSVSLSLQCGMTLASALVENKPCEKIQQLWPTSLRIKITPLYLENEDSTLNLKHSNKLWNLAERSWDSACRNYREGLPQVELIQKLSKLQENEFKHWMNMRSDKLSYLLLIPLFTLSVPAVLILLFAPLLSALLGS